RSTYRKLRRRGSFDFAALSVAVSLRLRGREVDSCRIVLGALASEPIIADEAGRLMEGSAPTLERVEEAARAAVRRARPVENADFPAAYRRRMAGVFVARALRDLTDLG
ncbi:MAG TPA: 4-hydroxybenzoyl-CoA reductase, partial [archaeon]|nr:4-hydroxybenzoyl-CoA reductase [archaeon]